VDWNDAKRFCRELTRIERKADMIPEGYEYRLPTEAEWEYACRAGTTKSLPNGKEIHIKGDIKTSSNAPALDSIAWYSGNSSVGYRGKRGFDISGWPRKRKPPNMTALLPGVTF